MRIETHSSSSCGGGGGKHFSDFNSLIVVISIGDVIQMRKIVNKSSRQVQKRPFRFCEQQREKKREKNKARVLHHP